MSHCPHCHADLSGVEHLTSCPACSASLPPKSQRGSFVADSLLQRELSETPQSFEAVDPLSAIKATLSAIAARANDQIVPNSNWTGQPLPGPTRFLLIGGAAAERLSYEEDLSQSHLAPPAETGADVTIYAKQFPTFGGSDLQVPDVVAPYVAKQETESKSDTNDIGRSSDPFAKTIDSGKFPPVAAQASTPEPDDSANRSSDPFARTIDSDKFPPVPEPPKPKTLPDRFAGTIDSDSFKAIAEGSDSSELDSELGTVKDPRQDPRYAHTIDSGNFDPVEADQPKRGTLPDRRMAATMAPGEFMPQSEADLAALWSGTHGADDRPGMTIKGQGPPKARDSKLVIRPRSLKNTGEAVASTIDYELLEKIGEGGMGMVYSARQASIDRTVALKMLKADIANNAEQRDKFLSEAVVTGDLDHPNIVPIYDLGANEAGALFYSMKRVVGTPWLKVLAIKNLAENIEILMKVADAVGFAHSRGVIHRDLKPENVMLGDFGEVLVMDWGLAMSTSLFRKAGSITQSGSMGGTPAYMAPEMATGPVDRIGPLSDVYLLGAMLYEIITGKPPHTGKNVMNCLFAAARNDIQPTNHSGELLSIAMQAMATRPEDRYMSVRDFQSAIRLYQSHSESISLSSKAEDDLAEAEKTGEYETYSRAVFAFEEALSLWEDNARARPGLSRARLAYARCAESKGDLDLGASLLSTDDPTHVDLLKAIHLAQKERAARQQRLKNAKRLAGAAVAAVLLVVAVAYVKVGSERDRALVAEKKAKEDRERALTAEEEAKQSAIAAAASAKEARAAELVARNAESAARLDRDKAQLAEKGKEYEAYIARIGLISAKIEENSFDAARELLEECPTDLRRWEWGRLSHLCQQSVRNFDCGAPVVSVAYSDDGKLAATGSWDGKVRIWQVTSGEMLRTIDYGGRYVHTVAMSHGGKLVAAGGNDQRAYVKVWNVETGEPVKSFKGHQDDVVSVTFSKDNQTLLTGSYDNTARLWNMATGEQRGEALRGHRWWVWCAAFSPDEKRIVTTSQDGSAIVWDMKTRKPGPAFTGHGGPVYWAKFSPHAGDPHVASGGYDNRVLIWDPDRLKAVDFNKVIEGEAPPAPEYRALEGHNGAVRCVTFSPDGKKLISASHDNSLRVWDYASGKLMKILRGHAGWVRSCDFSPDGQSVVSASQDHQAKLWSLEGYEEVRVVHVRVLSGHDDAVLAARFSPDGKQIVTASRDRTAKMWDFASGKQLQTLAEGHSFLASSAAFFPDGKRMVTSAMDNTTRIWDVSNGTQLTRLDGTGRAAIVAVSHDGQKVVTGGEDNTARLWSAVDGKLLHTLQGETSDISAVAFSFDNRQLVLGDHRGRVMLWNAETGNKLWRVEGYGGKITAATFLPDGKRVLTASTDNAVGQWDVETGKEVMNAVLKHPDAVNDMSVTADGVHAITSCDDNKLRVWNLMKSTLVGTISTGSVTTNTVAVSPDGKLAVTTSLDDRQIRLWDLKSGRERGAGEHVEKLPFLDLETHGANAWAAVFSPDGQRVLTVGGNDARMWNIGSGTPHMSFSPHGAVASASFSSDGQRVVTGSWDSSAKIWNLKTGNSVVKLAGAHHGYVNSAVFSPDDTKVLTASDDKTAKIWNAETGSVLTTLAGHTDRVRSAVYSTDGAKILTVSSDKTAIIWNAATGEQLITLRGHEAGLLSGVFSRDGSHIVTGGEDNTARIWDPADGELLLTISGHTAGVASVAMSDDGDRVLTGSQDNTAKLWDSQTGVEVLTLKGHTQEVTSVSFSQNGLYTLTSSRDGTAMIWLTSPWREPEKKPVDRVAMQPSEAAGLGRAP